MKTLATIVGARPQFIKAAPLSLAIAGSGRAREYSIHTGQHYDDNMAGVFFRELSIPEPTVNLNIGGGPHGQMTGRMLEKIEATLIEAKPDAVIVFGDTNSTLAGALAASKLGMPLVHIEAGLRSFNRSMPEEINRVVTDHVSQLLLCPTGTAVDNLAREGIVQGVHQVGDLMYDTTLAVMPLARERSRILGELSLEPGNYVLATIHRAENTADRAALVAVLDHVGDIAAGRPVVLPLHPRTRKAAAQMGVPLDRPELRVTDPLGYVDTQMLLANAAVLATDSGGMQKEAYFHRVPCVTMRGETEWVETIEAGWNRLWRGPAFRPRRDIPDYGDGRAAEAILSVILDYLA